MDKELISLRIYEIVKHIDLAINDLSNVKEEDFTENSLLARAVCFSIEQICENTIKLRKLLDDDFPGIPWDKIHNMRIIIAHMYVKVDIEKIYKLVKNNLPPLKEQMLEILNSL